jgi:CheY-like chemotaxis protein
MVPDIIITDLQMPKMTGFELIRAVRANPRIASIPIVALASKQVAIPPKTTPTTPSARTLIAKNSCRPRWRRR